MEMGSSSVGVQGGSGSNDSLHGLKFGKKIYFEDVGSGRGPVTTATGKTPLPATMKKGRGVGQGGLQQPPRCQVEGCKVDLTGAKTYYCRHKVCGMHSKSPKVIVAGMEQRFCQQCSRFHLLHEFDQGKRSCRRRLAGHNERRRKPPPGPFTSSPYCHLSPSFHEVGGRIGGLLMDFTSPMVPVSTRDAWPTVQASNHPGAKQWQGAFVASSSRAPAQAIHPYGRDSAARSHFADHKIQRSEHLGVSDSNCALSLLSNQPWEAAASTASSWAPMISTNDYGGAQISQTTVVTNYMSNAWSLKGHEASGCVRDFPSEMCLGLAGEPYNGHGRGQFPGELGLALKGSKEYGGCSSNLVHWSL